MILASKSGLRPGLMNRLLAVDVLNSIELTAGVFCMLCANACAATEFTFGLICCGPPAKTVDVCGVGVSELLVYSTVSGRATPQNGSPAYHASEILPTFSVISAFTVCWSCNHSELVPEVTLCDSSRAGKEKGVVSAGWTAIKSIK